MFPQSGIGVQQTLSPTLPRMGGIYLANVLAVIPEEHAVNVLLPSLQGVIDTQHERPGLKARVMEHRAGPYIGDVDLPRVGDWGVVVFPHGTHQYPVWLGSLYQTYNHIATSNQEERISHHDSGVYQRVAKDGTVEWSHPSGTYLRIGTGTDLASRTRFQRKVGSAKPEAVGYDIPSKPSPTVHVNHSSGLTVTIDPTGNLTIHVPGNETKTIDGDEAKTVDGNELHTVKGNLTIIGEANVVICGDDVTIKSTNPNPEQHFHLGGDVGEDFIALKAALDHIKSVFNSHTHPGEPAPNEQMTFTQDTHYTGQSKAT